mmetsp:Transcript_3281/g.4208  ORF Transcript_3281/g.4208 Transcript_3281/m.4208 type:complete len:137 (-) Transcript_3281:223-633(-)
MIQSYTLGFAAIHKFTFSSYPAYRINVPSPSMQLVPTSLLFLTTLLFTISPVPVNSFLQAHQNIKYQLESTHLFGRRGGGGVGSNKKSKSTKKENLPEKICVVCGRPFTWRKKWERCWDEVTCCSKRCNSERRRGD